jgi:DNA modification methylase
VIMPYYQDDQVTVLHGDCVEILAALPEASVDAVVTDPPYGLGFMGKGWDSFKPASSRSPGAQFANGSISGFTGNGPQRSCQLCGHLDGGASPCRCDSPMWQTTTETGTPLSASTFQDWCTAWATECLRVLKPGAHLLAFGGTRTWHRLTSAIEDAGFEIRDNIAWLHGQGFPKSLDVSKAIDKRGGNDGLWFASWLAETRKAAGIPRTRLAELFPSKPGGKTGKLWNWENGQGIPTQPEFNRLCDALGVERISVFDIERGVIAARVGVSSGYGPGSLYSGKSRPPVTSAATDAAQKWQGWGTALKPAFEPIVVARKPLTGAVAANVLAHGTGALNIDACRIHTPGSESKDYTVKRLAPGASVNKTGQWKPDSVEYFGTTADGRWPTNVVLDGNQADTLDRQSGILTSGANPARRGSDKSRNVYSDFMGQTDCVAHRGANEGGASRFFPVFRYAAKADSSERPMANGVTHPTVKPLDLMRWLVRLVAPSHGVVLDLFAGSGTTGLAAQRTGRRYIGIDLNAEYLDLSLRTRLREAALDFQEGA